MIDIPLQAIANQELSIPLEDARYVITVKEASGGMVCTIQRNDVVLIQNVRLCADTPVLPYEYLQQGAGNFFMSTQNQELPWWEQFGITQFMTYLTADEWASA